MTHWGKEEHTSNQITLKSQNLTWERTWRLLERGECCRLVLPYTHTEPGFKGQDENLEHSRLAAEESEESWLGSHVCLHKDDLLDILYRRAKGWAVALDECTKVTRQYHETYFMTLSKIKTFENISRQLETLTETKTMFKRISVKFCISVLSNFNTIVGPYLQFSVL